jgi:hypothetical protein
VEAVLLGAVGLVWLIVRFGVGIAGLVVALKVRRTAPRAGALLASGFGCKIAAGVLAVLAPIAGWLSLDTDQNSAAIVLIGTLALLSDIVTVAALGLIFAGFLGRLRRPRPAPHVTGLTGAR